jgi:predicted lactoylglutathione lyase
LNAKQKIKAARESSNVTTSERSLDHFVNLVGDIEIAAAMYKRLGFQTMPTMEHEKIGTSNVCLQFEGTYLELIGDLHLSNSDQLNDTIARWTKFGEYIYWMTSFTSSRLEMARKELQSLGLDPNEPLNAARKVRCVGGGWDTTDSSSMYTFREPNITGSFFHSEHLKPEAIWMPGYMIHPNSAIRIVGITYLADSLEADLDYQIKMIGGEPAQRSPDRVALAYAARGILRSPHTLRRARSMPPS